MVFNFNVLPCCWHIKHVFPWIIHSHLYLGRCLTRELALFLAEFVVQVGLTWPRLGFIFALFSEVPFFRCVTFLVQKRMTIAFTTSELFTRFSEGLFAVVSHSFHCSITSLLLVEELAKTIACHLECRFSVISERVIVGLVLMPLKVEILPHGLPNLMYTLILTTPPRVVHLFLSGSHNGVLLLLGALENHPRFLQRLRQQKLCTFCHYNSLWEKQGFELIFWSL